MKNDITVESWPALQDELFLGSWNESIQRFRSPFVFRGLSDCSYRLVTSLMRLGGPYATLEMHLLRNFRKYGRTQSCHHPSLWHLVALAQHHGLPTRLLDWTYSPYVALHFATANHEKYDIDGVIWVVDFEAAHRLLPDDMRHCLEIEGAQAYTVELLTALSRRLHVAPAAEDAAFHDVIEPLEHFDQLRQYGEFLLFFEPPSIDDRIVNQFALFSVMPNPERALDEWLDEHADLYRRIIIPGALKWEIRDKLDQCNISERVLFPGLDGLSSWLKRHYSPKS